MTEDQSTGKRREIPDWAGQAFERFLAQSKRLFHVVRLSVRGISELKHTPEAVKVLAEVYNTAGTPEHEQQLAWAQRDAELAQTEMDSGFPIVFSFGIVSLWSLLESTVRATVVAWLENDAQSFKIDAIGKVRVRVGEYEQLGRDEKYHYIADLLESELAAGLRNGVDRFEALLKPFGLDGPIPEKLRRNIFEFGQIRNAIVHRGGHADRQLAIACPWLGFPVGQELPVGQDHFDRYLDAAKSYVYLLICRVGERFGHDSTTHKETIFLRYASL